LRFAYSTGKEQEIDAKGTVSAGCHGICAAWFTLGLDVSRVAALQQAVRTARQASGPAGMAVHYRTDLTE
jgi:hypothetical protein